MFIDFNPLLLIFWIIVTSFIPGVLLFFGLFKEHTISQNFVRIVNEDRSSNLQSNEKRLNILEKILCGFGI